MLARLSAYDLVNAVVSTPEEDVRTRAVFPFFTKSLEVRFLLLVTATSCDVIFDLPHEAGRRRIRYDVTPRRRLPLAEMTVEQFAPMLHFDPWWALRDRADIPEDIRVAAMATNIANVRVQGARLANIDFDTGLLGVVGGRIRPRLRTRRVSREDLLTPLSTIHDPAELAPEYES